MEKMRAASGPEKSLSADQKRRIADLDRRYTARVAETRLGYEQRIAAAAAADRAALRDEMVKEIARIEDKRASEKAAVWEEAAG
jgi:hypothetical protein